MNVYLKCDDGCNELLNIVTAITKDIQTEVNRVIASFEGTPPSTRKAMSDHHVGLLNEHFLKCAPLNTKLLNHLIAYEKDNVVKPETEIKEEESKYPCHKCRKKKDEPREKDSAE